ncbi:class I SAM-dependent methyltransferase [Parasphingorhabdus litoris]|uniref:Class I SAM-dependent methyltransferase n=1 Tax=Parasphingorhabdus litoris TaxID=394733 RepID=A0ABN1AFQ0_9SPHN|nr:class I SAM-dependent methyltransferase [Parasphingorhabdus litoris]
MSIFQTKIDTVNEILSYPVVFNANFASVGEGSEHQNQQQTNNVFTEKWSKYDDNEEQAKENLYAFQRDWYLKLYGFESEEEFAQFLQDKPVILDAGCGLGYKAAWFAKLAPNSLVIGMDFSDAAKQAAEIYKDVPNLLFMRGDIASTPFQAGSIAYVSCDQVIMHTENPDKTFSELCRICEPEVGQFACYFYAKKALPRELVDDYFRTACKDLSSEQLWGLSEQLTTLGKTLSELDVKFDCPDIPVLGIKGGEYDIQRFLYWNFLKCFWNKELGQETSVATNFDWYSPSNARRFNIQEVNVLAKDNHMIMAFIQSEEACHSGRFVRQ